MSLADPPRSHSEPAVPRAGGRVRARPAPRYREVTDADRRTPGYRAAHAISYTLNPLVLPPVAFALLDAHFGGGPGDAVRTFAVSLVFFCLVPLGYVAWMVRTGRTATYEVREQDRRWSLFLVGIASYVLGTWALSRIVEGPALPVIAAFAALYPLNSFVLLLVNLRWKISLHMTSMAGFVGVLLFATLTVWRDLPPGVEAALTVATVVPLLALVPLLMWARLRVGAHSWGQVVSGALFGLTVLPAQLWWIVYVWLDLAG